MKQVHHVAIAKTNCFQIVKTFILPRKDFLLEYSCFKMTWSLFASVQALMYQSYGQPSQCCSTCTLCLNIVKLKWISWRTKHGLHQGTLHMMYRLDRFCLPCWMEVENGTRWYYVLSYPHNELNLDMDQIINDRRGSPIIYSFSVHVLDLQYVTHPRLVLQLRVFWPVPARGAKAHAFACAKASSIFTRPWQTKPARCLHDI